MKSKAALTAVLVMSLYGPLARAAADCDNFFGQHCRIDLWTGVHMSYFELGPPAGETLIMLHTDTTGAVEWAWTVNALLRLDPNLHVYALDQRGAGATDLPNTQRCWTKPNLCITRADLAADVLAFMDAKNIVKAPLVGHAMGAGAARRVALDHPERVVRLILSGTGAPPRLGAPPSPQPAHPAQPAQHSGAPSDVMAPLGWQ